MYAHNLFGWVERLQSRIDTLTEVRHVGTADGIRRHTAATQLELTEFLEVLDSIPIPAEDIKDTGQINDAILRELLERKDWPVALASLTQDVREDIERSDRFDVSDGTVLVPLTVSGSGAANVIPTVTYLQDRLLILSETARTVVDFLIADKETAPTHLRAAWRGIWSLCRDMYHYCIELRLAFLQQSRRLNVLDQQFSLMQSLPQVQVTQNETTTGGIR